VWFPNEGWVRVDPTAAVSPLRVESGIAAAIPTSTALPLLARSDMEWLRQLRFTWDSLANSWNQWVLGYNPERQFWLLSRVGLDRATWQTLAFILAGTTALITLAFAYTMLRQLSRRSRDPAAAAYERFCRKLARRGITREPSEGPVAYATRAGALLPQYSAEIGRITDLYVQLRYGRRAGADAIRDLRGRIRALKVR
jgi:hypothetical protein